MIINVTIESIQETHHTKGTKIILFQKQQEMVDIPARKRQLKFLQSYGRVHIDILECRSNIRLLDLLL